MRVLVTRAEKEGRATAARLEALGHIALVEPLTTIVAVEALELPAAESLQAVTATSLNAVEVLAGRPEIAPLLALPFLAVGARTAEAARAVGFTDVHSADGDRRDLTKAITSELDPAKGAILWLVGRDRAGDLVGDLAPAGFAVVPVEVYRAEPVERLSETARTAIAAGEVDAALVFSPRSGAILIRRLAECGFSPGSLTFPVHVISEATARPFREVGWREVVVATSPDTEAMLATLRTPPTPADPIGDEIRSSPMPPRSRKDSRAAPATEAEVGAAETAAPVEPSEAAVDPDRAEEDAFRARVEAAAKAETAPRVEPETVTAPPAVPPQAPRARGMGFGGVLVATLLGGALGVGGSYGLALQGYFPTTGGDGGRVAALEAAIAGLKTQKPATDPVIADRLTALEKRAAAPATDTAVLERLGALEQYVRQMAAAPAAAPAPAPVAATGSPASVDLSGIEGRLARLEAAKPAAPDLSGLEARLGKLEGAPKPAADLTALEERLGRLEGVPQVRLPVDLADRVAGLEAAAKARAESAAASVAGALSGIAAEGASRQALAEMAGQVDRALGSLRENAGAEIAALKARIERLGSGIDAESRALVDRAGADAKALAARLGIETQGVADRLAAQTAATVEDLRKRNDELSRALTERMNALVAASDVEGRRRIEDLARGFSEKTAALAAAVEAEAAKRAAETAEALKKLRGDVDAALGRVATLETATREVGNSGQKLVEKVGEAAAAAETKVGALENRLAGIEAEAEAARRARGEAMVAIALSDLKAAAETGRPFATELSVVEAASKGGLDLSALKLFADKGMPTAASLRAGWAKVSRAAVAAGETRDGGGGVLDRLLSNAGSMVKVRQPGDAKGDDVVGLAGRVDTKLAAGDLAGALAAWKALPEASRKASAAWSDTLAARVAADAALADRIAAVNAKLAQPK
ncbi:MAG: uroporphyrinogen-III synthase [Siculibacillus sp.]|nr:uroporphyrinogen-III synthase [Siculibacillus sp.]